MEKEKQHVIREAFGKAWKFMPIAVQAYALLNDGWVFCKLFSCYQNINGMSNDPITNILDLKDYQGIDTSSELEYKKRKWRPVSLRGIEHNNFWVKLTGVKNEIPLNTGPIHLYNIHTKEELISQEDEDYIAVGRFTHWKPVPPTSRPIY